MFARVLQFSLSQGKALLRTRAVRTQRRLSPRACRHSPRTPPARADVPSIWQRRHRLPVLGFGDVVSFAICSLQLGTWCAWPRALPAILIQSAGHYTPPAAEDATKLGLALDRRLLRWTLCPTPTRRMATPIRLLRGSIGRRRAPGIISHVRALRCNNLDQDDSNR